MIGTTMAMAAVTLEGRSDVRVGAVSDQRSYRLASLDLLRGLVIVIMAIDHVRDFFLAGALQDPTTDPNITLGMFMTRWITHFCAPVFVLLAGVSAGLMAARRSPNELARFLFTRGVWLIAIECLVISTSATFAPAGIPQVGGRFLVTMQVIWAIGASMIVLAGAQKLGRRACLAGGALILIGHNLLDPVWPQTGLLESNWPLWAALHSQMSVIVGPFMFTFVYPLLPWIGVMLFGFGVAALFEREEAARKSALLKWGLALTAAFVVLRAVGLYGDPNPWQSQARGVTATVIDFLNTTKYPPSLDFVLMTLGPAAILCAFADRIPRAVGGILTTFGRVPFAFYVAHVILIHTLSVVLGVAQGFRASEFMTLFLFYPPGYGVSLFGVYVVWAVVIMTLYPYCRWMAGVKARRRDWWLSYV
jgi:uncharacterized membrane protein